MEKENSERLITVGLGELLWDNLPEGRKVGGAPANFAYHIAMQGIPAAICSAVGDDVDGEALLKAVDSSPVIKDIPRVQAPTGQVYVTMRDAGIPSYEIAENVAYDYIPVTPELEEIASRCGAVCFGTLAQRSEVSHATIMRFLDMMPQDDSVLRVFDINLRPPFYTLGIIEESLKRCNILKINEEELTILARMHRAPSFDIRDICGALLRRYNLKMVVLTCGDKGSFIFTEGDVYYRDTPEVDIADTVGAGDSFTAGLVGALLKGATIEEAHRHAVDLSAYVCSCAGPTPLVPEALIF